MPVDTQALGGAPAQAVTDAGADALMLAVGSRGSSAFAAMVLGSVGRYAATHGHCPVVVVREEASAANRQVVVGIHDLNDCAAALGFAFEEAAVRNASLIAVHAWQVPRSATPPVPGYVPDSVVSPSVAEIQENLGRQLEQLLASWSDKYPNVSVSHDIAHGHPGRALAGLSARADLVVLGRHGGHTGTGRVIHTVLGHAHGPVAVVPST